MPDYNDYWNWVGPRRHVQIDITMDQWIGWWVGTGKWKERGRGNDEYCMGRIDYEKPFSLDNIRLMTVLEMRRRANAYQFKKTYID